MKCPAWKAKSSTQGRNRRDHDHRSVHTNERAKDGRACPGSPRQVWGRDERGFSKLLPIYLLRFPKNYCSLRSLVLREKRARGNMEVLDHKRALTSNKGLVPKGANNMGKGCGGDCKGDRRGMFKKAFLPPQC